MGDNEESALRVYQKNYDSGVITTPPDTVADHDMATLPVSTTTSSREE